MPIAYNVYTTRITVSIADNASEVQLDTAIVSRLWVPNTFFVHVQSVTRPMLLSDASGIILYQNKTVSHVSRTLPGGSQPTLLSS